MPNRSLDQIRHSLAHILAFAVKRLYKNVRFGVGPVTETGFFYDFDFSAVGGDAEQRRLNADQRGISEGDLPRIEEEMRKIIKEGFAFERQEVSAAEARKILKDQPFKHELIDDLEKYGTTEFSEIQKLKSKPDTGNRSLVTITLYTIGDFTDLCRGGHVEKTSDIDPGAFALTNIAGAYWRGSEQNPQMTRIYGAAFKNKKELDSHREMLEEAKRRDHRLLGRELDLFSQHSVSPGAIFWHPKGMVIWRELEKLIREKNDAYGYGEVSTPIMVKKELFETSGHWQHYRENGFWFDIGKETFVLKPMNCPESTLVYSSALRSYRDLPLRLSEPTGRLHRQELSGVVGGLFRVTQLTQDDAHVFCRPDQIEEEIEALIRYTQEVYKLFDLPLAFKLATKPDKAMGDEKLWTEAESALENVLKKSRLDYELKPKDGAFYGPKIDVHAKDTIGREWQLSTIQLDFQMPERFRLEYVAEGGTRQRPVMIHRAILGSYERFIGVIIEHFAGAFPTWLAPVQAVILPVSEKFSTYAKEVLEKIREVNIRVEFSDSDTLGKRIRQAELQKIPYILVVGDKEAKAKSINVRSRKTGKEKMVKLESFVKDIKAEINTRSL